MESPATVGIGLVITDPRETRRGMEPEARAEGSVELSGKPPQRILAQCARKEKEMTADSSRRRFLKTTATLGAARSMLAAPEPALPDANIYTRLGIRPVINGVGVVTILGGSIMPPEVVHAMEEASHHFVPLTEL